MTLVFDPVTVLNLCFDVVILALGAVAFVRVRGSVGLLVGIGFGFFAISYILTIFGYGSATVVLLPIRVVGYLSVIVGLCLYLFQAPPRPHPAAASSA
jgi:hypothetical protein